MTCPTCQYTPGFVPVFNKRTGEIRGERACPRCRPGDDALVRACEALKEKRPAICYEHGKWTEEATSAA